MKKVVLALCFVFALGLVTVNAQEKKAAAAKTEQPAAKKAVNEKKAEKKSAKPAKSKKAAEAKK